MARGALTEHNQILADRLKTELGVEGSNAHDLGGGDAGFLRDQLDRFLRQVTVDILCVLQNGDEAALDGRVLGENAVQQGQVNGSFFHY